ncbi:MAG: Omp28-related outer membrane protein [Bacteroidales bacterium]|nr:Omp28-related outer membrane protein [Bacteroidales bacterium]
MKKSLTLFALALLLGMAACDYIDDPIQGGGTDPVDPNPGETGNKTVLIKDFTGAQCVNCPEAAEYAHALQHQLGEDRIFVMGVHAGALAQPVGNFPDFLTEEGTAWYAGQSSNPLFAVDYVGLEAGHALYQVQLDAPVAAALKESQTFAIELTPTYNAADRRLEVEATVTAVAALDGDFYLTFCLVEDSLVGWQKIPGGLDREYVFRNVFRGTLNGADGEAVYQGSVHFNDAFSKHAATTLDAGFDEDRCYLVAYVYDRNQDKKILQTAVAKIK